MKDINPPANINNVITVKQTKLGVIDRFEGNQWAVILIEKLNEEIIIDKRELPISVDVNVWLNIEYDNEQIINITINEEKTNQHIEISNYLKKKLLKKVKKTSTILLKDVLVRKVKHIIDLQI